MPPATEREDEDALEGMGETIDMDDALDEVRSLFAAGMLEGESRRDAEDGPATGAGVVSMCSCARWTADDMAWCMDPDYARQLQKSVRRRDELDGRDIPAGHNGRACTSGRMRRGIGGAMWRGIGGAGWGTRDGLAHGERAAARLVQKCMGSVRCRHPE